MKHKSLFRYLALLACVLLLLALPAFTLAEAEAGSETDTAGNTFFNRVFTGEQASLDLYGAGESVTVRDAGVKGSVLLAGSTLTVENTRIGGSLRAGGYELTVRDTTAAANATVAGYKIDLLDGFSAAGVYAAGNDITFSGSCSALYAAGLSVTVNGTVAGDAVINAKTVTVGEGAVITGTLKINAAEAPVIADGASVGNLDYTETQTEEANAAVGTALGAMAVAGKLLSLVYRIPARLLLAVIYYLVIRKTMKQASDMVTSRPAYMPVSGLVALLAAPIAVIALFCTVIGSSAALLLLLLLALVFCFSSSFAASFIAQRIFQKMHPLLASIIGVITVTAAGIIPVLGGIVTLGCICYTLGYFVQRIFLNWKKPAAPASAPDSAAPAAQDAAPSEPSEN